MFVNTKLSLFLQFTSDCENIILKNYHYYSTVTNLVYTALGMHACTASADIKYAKMLVIHRVMQLNISTVKVISPTVISDTPVNYYVYTIML